MNSRGDAREKAKPTFNQAHDDKGKFGGVKQVAAELTDAGRAKIAAFALTAAGEESSQLKRADKARMQAVVTGTALVTARGEIVELEEKNARLIQHLAKLGDEPKKHSGMATKLAKGVLKNDFSALNDTTAANGHRKKNNSDRSTQTTDSVPPGAPTGAASAFQFLMGHIEEYTGPTILDLQVDSDVEPLYDVPDNFEEVIDPGCSRQMLDDAAGADTE
jgi:hypothetical protein